ncbi:MAG: hypothetical protein AAFR55_01500 [Pseudomonadota bacterium]
MSSCRQDTRATAAHGTPPTPDIICVIDTHERVRALEGAGCDASAAGALASETSTASNSAAAHALLRHVVALLSGPDIAARSLPRTATGKPFLVDGPAFSLAHAGDLVMVAVSAPGRRIDAIGCDLEVRTTVAMSEQRRASVVAYADALLSDARLTCDMTRAGRAEVAEHASVTPGETSNDATLAAWVALEAYAKWTGDGVFRVLSRGGVFDGASQADARTMAVGTAPHAWARGAFRPAHGARHHWAIVADATATTVAVHDVESFAALRSRTPKLPRD